MSDKSIIIKLSSLALTKENGDINKPQLKRIISEAAALQKKYGFKVILVCSGAINAGRANFNNKSPKEISQLQACAAIGQPILMNAIQKELTKHNITLGQILVTHEDLKSKKRSFNIRNTLLQLLKNQNIVVINENDSVSFDEITVGDNDQLSAMIAELLGIKTLLMLTSPNGLYNKDPKEKDAIHYDLIEYDKKFKEVNLMTKSSAGRGGMKTKLQAIRKLTPLGFNVILASFKNKSPLLASLTEKQGTLFLGRQDNLSAHKNLWLLTRLKNDCGLKIDQGAYEALKKNSSLLPVGVIGTIGKFNRGDCIEISYKKKVVAIGTTEFSNTEVEKTKGLTSIELKQLFPQLPTKVVIHKNNLLRKEDLYEHHERG